MNRNWDNGSSVWSALTQGFKKGGRVTALGRRQTSHVLLNTQLIVKLARLLILAGLLRGPLNQRASVVSPYNTYEVQGSFHLDIAKKLPDGYTGINTYSRAITMETSRLTSNFSAITKGFTVQSTLPMRYSPCGDTCSATVKVSLIYTHDNCWICILIAPAQGFGFDAVCQISNFTIEQPSTAAFSQELFVTTSTIYQIGDQFTEDGFAWADTGIMLNATYFLSSDYTRDGVIAFNFTSHVCNMTAGTRTYDIGLTQNTIGVTDLSLSRSFEKM